jgi:hypothetical protein
MGLCAQNAERPDNPYSKKSVGECSTGHDVKPGSKAPFGKMTGANAHHVHLRYLRATPVIVNATVAAGFSNNDDVSSVMGSGAARQAHLATCCTQLLIAWRVFLPRGHLRQRLARVPPRTRMIKSVRRARDDERLTLPGIHDLPEALGRLLVSSTVASANCPFASLESRPSVSGSPR